MSEPKEHGGTQYDEGKIRQILQIHQDALEELSPRKLALNRAQKLIDGIGVKGDKDRQEGKPE